MNVFRIFSHQDDIPLAVFCYAECFQGMMSVFIISMHQGDIPLAVFRHAECIQNLLYKDDLPLAIF